MNEAAIHHTLVLVLLLVAIGNRFWHLYIQRRENAPGPGRPVHAWPTPVIIAWTPGSR